MPQPARLLRVDPGIGWRIRRFLGSPGHVVGALFGIVGIVMLNMGLISGLLAVGVIVGMYAIGYFLASRPAITQNIGALPAKDSDTIAAGLDQMLADAAQARRARHLRHGREHSRRDRVHARPHRRHANGP